MAFCRTVFLVVSALCLVSCVTSSSRVPVFIWGDLEHSSFRSNPLAKVSAEEFQGVLKQELASDPFTVVFIEETLSVEDFSRKSSDGGSSFPYLHESIGKAVYIPSVESALHVLKQAAEPKKADHVKLTENGLSAEIEPESGNFLFITLKDAREGETRAELLRRHNDFMQEMVSKLQDKYESVVAVYTAHYPSWVVVDHSRVRRQAESSGEYELNNLLLYVSNLTLNDGNRSRALTSLVSSDVRVNNTEMEAVLNFGDATINLMFHQAGGYWFFNSVEVTEGTLTEMLQGSGEVYAVEGFSYRCANNVNFASVNATRPYTLSFVDLKVQPFFQTSNTSELVFGDSFNCVGFFSVPIWSGLFVVFILLAITFYGILMMMDIRTMDRFDDPKGKTITINTSE